jgi:5-methylcytosine-specific restriction enzyme A
MSRKRFPARALMARLLEFGGRCADCRCKTGGAAGLDWDHIHPLAMGGADELDNLQPLCRGCHKAKTKTDAAQIGKARRMDQRNAGIKRQPRNPLPGSKSSKFKRRIDGTVESR